jgi:hypothetical protein
LCAHRLEAEIATASDKFIVVGRGIESGDTTAPHPNILAGALWNYLPTTRPQGPPFQWRMSLEITAQKQKGRPGPTGTPWKTTAALVRRNRKELKG